MNTETSSSLNGTKADAEPALRLLAEYYTARRLGAVMAQVASATMTTQPAFALDCLTIAEACEQTQLQHLEIIDAYGLYPKEEHVQDVEIGDRVFQLPDLASEYTGELLTSLQEGEMDTTNIPQMPRKVVPINEGSTEPGFLRRTVSKLRMPSAKEAIVTIGLGLLSLGVYVVATEKRS